jgi:drug/metabolite transporter (DMT)-like permease
VVAYLLAALAAFVNALTSVLQRIGVESAPESTTMRLSLMAHAIRRGIWLIGFALMLVVFGLLATALRFGELSVVQPVLTTELLFLLLILVVWFRYRLGWKEWLGSITIVVGLGGFFLVAAPKGGNAIPTNHQWVVASVLLIAIIAGLIVAAMRGPRWWRAAAFGAATAVTAAYTAALTKAITNYTKEGWGHVFTHFEPYMLAITGLGTVFLIQNALHAGPITASRTTMVTINPLVSILLGVTLFADKLRAGPGWVTLEILSLAVLVVGVVILARSPLVAGTQGGVAEEMLGGARARSLDGGGPEDRGDDPSRPAGGGARPPVEATPPVEKVPVVRGGPVG